MNDGSVTGPARRGGFALLTAALLLLLIEAPLAAHVGLDLPTFRFVFALVLASGVYAVSRRPWAMAIAAGMALVSFGLEWWLLGESGRPGAVATMLLLEAAFLGLLSLWVLYAVLEQEHVTSDTIFGGIAIFLLLGLTWMVLYAVLEVLTPGSFLAEGSPLAETSLLGAEHGRYPDLMYFSYVTLTTLGYGDIIPHSPAARSLAAGEAIVGQLYVAIFIARLVGLHLAQRGTRRGA